MKPTIVTSLYNINRVNLDGRNWTEYLKWFSITLRLNSPMVIFVDDDYLVKIITEIRGDMPTKIVRMSLEQTYYYKFKQRIDDILDSQEYKSKISSQNRIECRSSLYNIVQYSKFFWVELASQYNFFDTERFLWLDAGISRFFEGIDLSLSFTSDKVLDLENKIFLQIFMQPYPDLSLSNLIKEEYFWDDRSYVAGGIFLIHKNFITKFKSMIDQILESKMLDNFVINNEQICLGYLIKKTPENFHLFKHYHSIHKNYEILNFLQ